MTGGAYKRERQKSSDGDGAGVGHREEKVRKGLGNEVDCSTDWYGRGIERKFGVGEKGIRWKGCMKGFLSRFGQ